MVAGNITRISDGMMMAAALALSELAPALHNETGRLLPELSDIRGVSQHIAKAVMIQSIQENHSEAMDDNEIINAIKRTLWVPQYETFEV